MSYRPDGWENPYYRTEWSLDETINYNVYPEFGVFEAGADAMLGALKKDGVFTYGHHYPEIEDAPEVSGSWVFIPEETNENNSSR